MHGSMHVGRYACVCHCCGEGMWGFGRGGVEGVWVCRTARSFSCAFCPKARVTENAPLGMYCRYIGLSVLCLTRLWAGIVGMCLSVKGCLCYRIGSLGTTGREEEKQDWYSGREALSFAVDMGHTHTGVCNRCRACDTGTVLQRTLPVPPPCQKGHSEQNYKESGPHVRSCVDCVYCLKKNIVCAPRAKR